jgi:tetratricopeptide (TPR) repeat protein
MTGGGLLGEGHQAVLEELAVGLEALRAGDVSAPRVVVLEGHSGTGKSRLIRELYSRLQAGQPDNGYWPALPEAARGAHQGGGDPFADRKRLGPAVDGFVWPAGTLPTFLWWTFNCDRMQHGDLLDVVAQAGAELRAHLIPASLAWRSAAGWGDRLKASKGDVTERAREALTEVGVDAAAAVLASFNVAVPGLGLGLSWLFKAGQSIRRHRDDQRMINADVELQGHVSAKRFSAAEEIAGLLLAATHADLPSVVVIEDLHLMGPELGELIDILTVARRDKPVLVVGTAWPEGRGNQAYAQWRAKASERGALREIRMPDLDVDARVEMVRRAAPKTADADARRVAAHYENPLALEMLLSLSVFRRRIERSDGALVVSEGDLAELPRAVEDLYRHRWQELPEAVREALMLAAGALPGESSPGSWSFLRDIIAEASGRSGLLSSETAGAVTESLEAAEDPYYWHVSRGAPGAAVTAFREAVLADIAILDLRENFDPEDIDALRTATTAGLAEWIDHKRAGRYLLDTGDEQTLVAARWLWALTPPRAPPTIAVSVAGLAVAQAQADAFQYAAALTTLSQREWVTPLPPDHGDTLIARSNLGSWLGSAGRVDEAVTQFEALLADSTRILDADHPHTLRTRGDGAYWLGSSGRVGEAVTQFQALLADSTRILGADHPYTLTARGNLALFLGDAGRVGEAVTQFEALLVDRTRVLGADHPDTLRARGNLASCLGDAGRVGEAVTQFEALLVDQTRVLGADHPGTLSARNNVAFWLGTSGRIDEALTQSETLLADRTRVLGADHPGTLNTRSNVASWSGRSGQADEALTQFQALLADRTRVLGADHPDTLNTRTNLAYWLGRSGQGDEALTQFQALLADWTRVLGADHPGTLNTRSNVAFWLGTSGRIDEALTQSEALLADRTRVLGADHLGTLTTRNNIAYWLGTSGRIDEAITQFQALLVDRTRILGADHPDTLNTRTNLAYWLGTTGRVAEAVTQSEALLADRTRVLGTDHPDTLRTREQLMGWIEIEKRNAGPD